VNLRVSWRAEHVFTEPALELHVLLRVRPASEGEQRLRAFEVRADPPVRLHRFTDHFGAETLELDVPEPHSRLVVEAGGRVSTAPLGSPPAERGWAPLASRAYREAAAEFLAGGEPPREPAPASTSPLRAAREAAADGEVGAGVRRLREQGIAARQVTGYLLPEGESAVEGEDLHAWVEVLLPAGAGDDLVWMGIDRGAPVGEGHVKVAHGRGPGDVTPCRAVARGGREAKRSTHVLVERLEEG
jgi:transglutaminase-like putative cysteine protease